MSDGLTSAIRPNIAYVDELDDAREDFFTDAYQSGLFGEIFVLPPQPTLEKMVDELLGLPIEALISDFRLTEAGPVGYDGEGLVAAILARRAEFPCFIQTSFDEAAIRAAEDVNRVYSKDPKETDGRENFLHRVALQIERHHNRLTAWREELSELLAIDRSELTAAQIERILDLDDAIESNAGSDDPIAREAKRELLKSDKLGGRQAELLGATEKLIAEMRRALDE